MLGKGVGGDHDPMITALTFRSFTRHHQLSDRVIRTLCLFRSLRETMPNIDGIHRLDNSARDPTPTALSHPHPRAHGDRLSSILYILKFNSGSAMAKCNSEFFSH